MLVFVAKKIHTYREEQFGIARTSCGLVNETSGCIWCQVLSQGRICGGRGTDNRPFAERMSFHETGGGVFEEGYGI